ncbi:MAG: hypothetical protein ACR5LC_03505 [Symbiopectobacterium sp.]|uniref:hypothetical protein n=1 Tax=Symbiopectobacterium sp. TaxID=2952789 RepID=UPI003F358E9C
MLCILRGLNRLHQLEGVLFDADVSAFHAQISGEKQHTPMRFRKKASAFPPQTHSAPAAVKPVANSPVDWYISAAENNIIWLCPENEKKS